MKIRKPKMRQLAAAVLAAVTMTGTMVVPDGTLALAEQGDGETGFLTTSEEAQLLSASSILDHPTVYNTKNGTGMWDIDMLDYLYSSELGYTVQNYVKYIADDSANGWRLAYCTQMYSHFENEADYSSKAWTSDAMYSEISYAIEHGCSTYQDLCDTAYSTGNWLKDYYVTQAVIYCILTDYGYDGHAFESLSAVSGYEDVYNCVAAMYKDVKANAGSDGYGDTPTYTIVAPSSTEMTLTSDGTYYRSGWYTIDCTGDVYSRTISLEGAPSGCTIVYEDADNLTSRFYVQIPAEKAYQISGGSVSFKIKASAKFIRPITYIYQADSQNITFQQYTVPSGTVGSEATLKLTLEKCKIALTKKDSETGNGVSGAVYGIYSDEDCTDLVAEMPATDSSGSTSADFIMRQSTYYVKEITASVNYLISTSAQKVSVTANQTTNVTVTEDESRGKITVTKIDAETGAFEAQGDATLVGAVYGLYAREDIEHPDGQTGVIYPAGTLVDQKTFSSSGQITFTDLYFGSYYIKEISAPTGYLKDETEYDVDISYQDEETPVVSVSETVEETVKKQAFQIIKVSTAGSSEETQLVSGAEFTVKLASDVKANGWENAETYDILVTDGSGYAQSVELPYGTYLVKETKTPDDMNTTDDFYVTVSEDSRTPQIWRAFNDAPFSAYIRLIKKDAETGEVILLGGTTFKIRDLSSGEDVSMKVGSAHVSVFETDETGMVTTPLQLEPGEYEVYEITAPEGYVVHTESIPFTVSADGEYHTDDDGDFVVDIEIYDEQQYGNVSVYKQGEALVGVTAAESLADQIQALLSGESESSNLDFIYEDRALAGCTFQVICDEDIFTADHQLDENGTRRIAVYQGVELKEGAVAATVTTDESGYAYVTNLPLGSYRIVEIQTADGYVKSSAVDSFTLEYGGQDVAVVSYESSFINERQKTALTLVKTSTKEEKSVSGAVYGLYPAEDIISCEGEVLVKADTLIEAQETDANGEISFAADLPLGLYYIKEIEAADGYYLDESIYEVDLTWQGQEIEIASQSLTVTDEPTITEIRKTDIATGAEIPGAELQVIDSEGNVVEEWISGEAEHIIYALPEGSYTLRETLAPTANGYVCAQDVAFEVTADGETTQVEMQDDYTKVEISKKDITGEEEIPGASLTLLDEEGNVIESWISSEEAHYIERLPVGTYILREESAPEGYIVASEVTFEVEETGEVQSVVMCDETAKGRLILTKTDADTGKALKGVEYELRDSDGNVLETLVTDKNGQAESGLYEIASFANGVYDEPITYILVETKALKGYVPDDTEYEITFSYVDDQTPIVEIQKEFTNQKIETPAPKTGDLMKKVLAYSLTAAVAGITLAILTVMERHRRRQK